jgi:hypothetical protein
MTQLNPASLHALFQYLYALALVGSAKPAEDALGPGPGEWASEAPELHGLRTAELKQAAMQIQAMVPERSCFLVARNGKLVHETYWNSSKDDKYESDSLAKTGTAELIGVAVSRGLLDLDKPLAEYGVQPVCPDENEACTAMLQQYCEAHKTDARQCAECTGLHQLALHSADCTAAFIDAFCGKGSRRR